MAEAQQLSMVVESSGDRLDRWLAAALPGVSRAEIQRWIKEARASVNGRPVKASHRLVAGDVVSLDRPAAVEARIEPQDIPLTIVFEDDELVVVDKPAGMVVHPAPGHSENTLVNALLALYPELADVGGPERAGVVHRLDRDTSGLLVVARTNASLEALQAQFKARSVGKVYLALSEGRVQPIQARIEAPIGRDPVHRKRMAVLSQRRGGRPAVTSYRVLSYLEPKVSPQKLDFTLLEVDLLTGRTHQIRVHLAFLKHPVVGDRVYGRRRQRIHCPRQFLHATRLVFTHPTRSERITLDSPLPPDLSSVLETLRVIS